MIVLPPIHQQTATHLTGEPVTPADSGKFAYYFLTREKKSRNWSAAAFVAVAGDCCLAVAERYFAERGYVIANYSLQKVVDETEWLRFQTTYHLRQLKIKIK